MMRSHFRALAICLLFLSASTSAQSIEGSWDGVLRIDGKLAVFHLDIATDGPRMTGTLSVPSENIEDFDIGTVRTQDEDVAFAFTHRGATVPIVFGGKIDDEGRVLGTVTSGASTGQFRMDRAASAGFAIPRAALGIFFFLLIAWLMSSHKRRLNWRVIAFGIAMQLVLGFLILKWEPGRDGLNSVSQGVSKFLSFSEKGSQFVFGPLGRWQVAGDPAGDGPPIARFHPHFLYGTPGLEDETVSSWPITFAFVALPTIIFFSAVMAILYYLGIIQFFVRQMARFMMWALRVSGAESLAMAANVFVGQTEAPLVVKPYIDKMTRSELMALMTGGFATIAGSVLAAYIGFLGKDYAGHLLAASFMSAPAAFVMAKIMLPETEQSVTAGVVKMDVEKGATNVLEAAANGTADGLRLALNVGAMLIAFVAIVALIDWPLSAWIVDDEPMSLGRIFGWIFYPVAWLMGVPGNDCSGFGTLLGTKIAVNEFLAFETLGSMEIDAMSARARAMGAYALCGFANFASIGIQLGGIGPIAPNRKKELAQLALRAMLGGAFASWMTATIAGAFL